MWEKTVTINIALEDNPIHKWHYVTFRHILKQKKKVLSFTYQAITPYL